MAGSIPCSRLLSCLFALLFYYLALIIPSSGSVPPSSKPETEPSLREMISEMGNQDIISDLNGASVKDLKHPIERQIYLAIMHASTVLGSGPLSKMISDDEHTVKQETEAYLRDMLKRMKDIEIEYARAKQRRDQMKRQLYRAIIQASILQSLIREITIPDDENDGMATTSQDFMAWSIPYSRLLPWLLLLSSVLFLTIMAHSRERNKAILRARYLESLLKQAKEEEEAAKQQSNLDYIRSKVEVVANHRYLCPADAEREELFAEEDDDEEPEVWEEAIHPVAGQSSTLGTDVVCISGDE